MPVLEIASAIAGSKLIETCWTGVVGNYTHSGCEWLRKSIPSGTPQNHDVLKALHKCFRESLKIMADRCSLVDGANRDSRAVRRKLGDFARSTALARLDLEKPDIPDVQLETQIRTIYGQQDREERETATAIVIAYIEQQIGHRFTEAIRKVFLDPPSGEDGWAATFELLFAAEIKTNEKVRSILLFSRANELVALAEEQGDRIEALFDQLDRIEEALEEIDSTTKETLKYVKHLVELAESGGTSRENIEELAAVATNVLESKDPEQQPARDALLAGDPVDAARKLRADARRDHAAKAMDAGYLALPFDGVEAMAAFAEVSELDPANVWAWIELGRLKVQYVNLAAARTCFNNALQHVTDERDRGALLMELGDVLVAEGNLSGALHEFEAGLGIVEALAEADPSSASLRRDISVSLDRVGDVMVAQGRLSDALERFERGLGIREALAEADPSSASLRRDISVSLNKVGDVMVAQGRLSDALERFERGLGIREALAEADPSPAINRRDVCVSLWRVADVLGQLGRGGEALALARRAEGISAALVALAPDHAVFANDLAFVRGFVARLERGE